jgi:CHAD domain-containing protein
MAFQLNLKESVSDGIQRNVRREVEKALNFVVPEMNPQKNDTSEAEVVREIRKCFKKVRAALRLVREELGDDIYHRENWFFRDAARPLSEVRDAQMLVEILEKFARQLAHQIDSKALAKVHDALNANQLEVTHRVLEKEKALAEVKDFATQALARLSDWGFDRSGWDVLESGLARTYRISRRALSVAMESPSVVNLHEWRKQNKYLWHQLQLIEPMWIAREKELGNQFHQLSRTLGEDHDLAVLKQTFAVDPLAYGGHRFLKEIFVLIDSSRGEYERAAFTLGRQLYKESPNLFTNRIASDWKSLPEETKRLIPPRTRPTRAQSRPVQSGRAKQRGVS